MDKNDKQYQAVREQVLQELEQERVEREEEEVRIKEIAVAEVLRIKQVEDAARVEAEKTVKESEKPWVTIIGVQEDPLRGIKIELDWNDAFIQHLKDNGYTGADENQIIQKYLGVLYKNMMEKIESDAVTESAFE